MSYICNDPVLVPNKAQTILERDEAGGLVGAYTGYYNYKKFTVTLYPQWKHPFVRWRGTPTKKVISAALVKCSAARSVPEKEKPVKSQTSRGMRDLRDIKGQEKMKF